MFWEPISFISVAIDNNIHRQQHERVLHLQSNATTTKKEQIVLATYVQQMDLASVGIDQNVFIIRSMFQLQILHTLENQELNDLWEDKLKYLGHYNCNMVNKTSKQILITTTTNGCLDRPDAPCKLINFQSNQLKLYAESISNDTWDTMSINNDNNIHINSTFHVLKGLLFFFSVSCFLLDFKFHQPLSPVFFILRLKHNSKLISRTCCMLNLFGDAQVQRQEFCFVVILYSKLHSILQLLCKCCTWVTRKQIKFAMIKQPV